MENLLISAGFREDKYQSLFPQLDALWEQEPDFIANLANAAAALKQTFGFHWVGFYRVNGSQLILGPFQGPIACSRIGFGKGVCGTAWERRETILVPDVDRFPGHIACSTLSKSEIVVPVKTGSEEIVAVLDIDSAEPDDFSEIDQFWLEKICERLGLTYK